MEIEKQEQKQQNVPIVIFTDEISLKMIPGSAIEFLMNHEEKKCIVIYRRYIKMKTEKFMKTLKERSFHTDSNENFSDKMESSERDFISWCLKQENLPKKLELPLKDFFPVTIFQDDFVIIMDIKKELM